MKFQNVKRVISRNNIILLLFFTSCGNADQNSQQRKKLYLSKSFYENGVLKYCNLKNQDSLIEGVSYSFRKNGEKMTETHFENGLKEGEMLYYVDLSIASEENFKRDTLEGVAKYYVNGLISEEGSYKRGQKDGIWNYYENGELILSEFYSNGEIEKIIFDNRN